MAATAINSVTMVLWKETAFPLCRAMERRWKRNVVSRVSSVIAVMSLSPPESGPSNPARGLRAEGV